MQTPTSQAADRTILVPVDFSPAAQEALHFALQLAACSSRRLVVLHVVHEDIDQQHYPRNSARDRILPLDEIAENLLQRFMVDMRERHPGDAALANAGMMVVSGLPATRITEIAQRIGAGLIVMGCNGRSGLARLLAGSVSEKVARDSRVPVTIVHANGTVSTGGGQNHDKPDARTADDGARLYLVN